MASADRELEQQLMEAGNRLLQLPSSVDELLLLLDQVETYLSRVEQSPPISMQTALSPSLKALVEDELLRHSDFDVKVSVASCISEITRITAPDAPYDDDKMKEVFQLIVSSFENLSDKSSRSYNKRALILETVAKVRSCVVMLDLECDALIVEMFKHFLKSVRDYHPESVFSSMETIMTLVLEESEEVSLELLTPILACVKRNEEVLPIARKLGERVIENCAVKLKPYLEKAVRSLDVSLDDYGNVVASVCEGTTGAVEHNEENTIGEQLAGERKLNNASSDEAAQVEESKLTTASSDVTAQVAKECVTEEVCREEVDPALDRSPKSVMSNGIPETGNEGTSVYLESSKELEPEPEPEHDHLANQSLNVNLTSKADTDDSDAGKLVKSESKPEQTAKRRGRKHNSLIDSKEPSDSSRVDSEKEAEKLPERRKSRSKNARTSPHEDPSVEAVVPSENEKETVNVASPSLSASLPDESHPKKARRSKKKERPVQEDAPSVDVVSVKASEATSDSEVKPQRPSRKKAKFGVTKDDKILAELGTSKNEGGPSRYSEAKSLRQSGKKGDASDSEAKSLRQSGKKGDASDSEAKPLKQSGKKGDSSDSEAKSLRQSGKKGDASDSEAKLLKQPGKKGDASDSEAKPLKQSGKKGGASDSDAKQLKPPSKKGGASNNIEDKSSSKKEDGKRRGRGKDKTEKDLTSASAKDDIKEMFSSPKPTTKSAKDEAHIEETPKLDSKRKRTPGKDKVSETAEYGENIVGLKVKVWWPEDRMFYEGVIDSFDADKKKHQVLYTDGDEESLNLIKERWEFVEVDGEQATEDPNPDDSSETHKRKKAKTNSELSTKQEKTEVSLKRGSASSGRKSKGTATKSGRKSKDDVKLEKSKDNPSKSSGKSENDTAGVKSTDHSKKAGGKSVDDGPKATSKSKEVDGGTPKSTAKSKQGTPKTVTKSKGKTPLSGSKSNDNGTAKVKSSASKVKESDDAKGKTPDSAKSGAKSGKKRRGA